MISLTQPADKRRAAQVGAAAPCCAAPGTPRASSWRARASTTTHTLDAGRTACIGADASPPAASTGFDARWHAALIRPEAAKRGGRQKLMLAHALILRPPPPRRRMLARATPCCRLPLGRPRRPRAWTCKPRARSCACRYRHRRPRNARAHRRSSAAFRDCCFSITRANAKGGGNTHPVCHKHAPACAPGGARAGWAGPGVSAKAQRHRSRARLSLGHALSASSSFTRR